MRKEISPSTYISGVSPAAAAQLAPRRVRLWLICDEEASLPDLNTFLRENEAVMTTWTDLWASRPRPQGVEVVVVDVNPARLASVLKLLREDLGYQQSAILVNVRMDSAPQPSGVLPQYRAMACPWKDVLRLTQTCLQGVKAEPSSRPLL